MNTFFFNNEKLIADAIAQNIKMMGLMQKTEKVSKDAFQFYLENLEEAGLSLLGLINPVAVIKEIHFTMDNQDIILNDIVKLNNENLKRSLQKEAKIILYGLTLSFETETLLRASNYDYALSQFQYMLGKTMLLNMGKELFESCKIIYPDKRLMRYAIFQQDSEKNKMEDKNLWSPLQIAKLIPELNNENFQVTANENGCLQPLFSIVGIMTTTEKQSLFLH